MGLSLLEKTVSGQASVAAQQYIHGFLPAFGHGCLYLRGLFGDHACGAAYSRTVCGQAGDRPAGYPACVSFGLAYPKKFQRNRTANGDGLMSGILAGLFTLVLILCLALNIFSLPGNWL